MRFLTIQGGANMPELSHQEQEFLKIGYERGFVILLVEPGSGFIRTDIGDVPRETHKPLLDSLRAKGFIKMAKRGYYTLTQQGRTLVERLRAGG